MSFCDLKPSLEEIICSWVYETAYKAYKPHSELTSGNHLT